MAMVAPSTCLALLSVFATVATTSSIVSWATVKGSLEVKLLTMWTDEKAEVGRVREEKRSRRSEERRGQKKKGAAARKGKKVAKHCDFFACFMAPEM